MRILLLSDDLPPKVGGAGKAAWTLARGLQQRGHQVHVVTATAGPPTLEQRAGIDVHAIRAQIGERWRAYRSIYNPAAVRAFARILEQVRPDVVNAHNVHVHLSYGCLSVADQWGAPVVFTAQDALAIVYGKLQHYVAPSECPPASPDVYRLPPWHNLRQARGRFNPLRNVWIRHVLRHHVRARVAVSQALRLALEVNGLPAFQVIPNGTALDELEVTPGEVSDLRDSLGLRGRRVILLAGRIGEAKGGLLALAAMAKVIDAVPDALLLILSPRPFSLGAHEGLRGTHVRFAGWRTGRELAAAYALANVVTMPSVYLDAFGLVNVEAMAARKPVVATCHGGAPEIVQDGVTGFVVNPFDTSTFAARLIEVLQDEGLQARLGQAGYRRFREEFTMERFAERMSAVFEEVTA